MRLSSAKSLACVRSEEGFRKVIYEKQEKERAKDSALGDTRRDRGIVRASAVEKNTLSPVGQKSSDPVKSLSS